MEILIASSNAHAAIKETELPWAGQSFWNSTKLHNRLAFRSPSNPRFRYTE